MNYDIAQKIRKEYKNRFNKRVTQQMLADKYGVHYAVIQKIISGKTFTSPVYRLKAATNTAPILARLHDAGLQRLVVWVYPDDVAVVQAKCQRHRYVLNSGGKND